MRVTIDFGLTSDWMTKWREFLSQSVSVIVQYQNKSEQFPIRESVNVFQPIRIKVKIKTNLKLNFLLV